MENKYERAVDKSLTYHFIADRLDGYILEERLLLRQLEDKVHFVPRILLLTSKILTDIGNI